MSLAFNNKPELGDFSVELLPSGTTEVHCV